jgi:uncharacterized protein (TIGR00255 family)
MRSMTGHGRGIGEAAGHRVTVEIRAVNHRYFDLKLRAGPLDPRVEDAVGQGIRKRAERGAFTVTLRDEVPGQRGGPLRIDVEAARAVHAALEELRRALGYSEPVPLALVLEQPGIVAQVDTAAEAESLLAALGPALEAALDELVAMRRREGAALARDLGARLDRLAALAIEIEALAAGAPAGLAEKLRERVDKLLAAAGISLDEGRLAVEIAALADRTDVTEELVRLRAHLAALRSHLGEDVPVGRRLDFLVQEVGREVNTIGSKSQSSEIARRVVEAKAELEKIREQVQNVE